MLNHQVREATTKSLSITQRILLWLSDTASSASSKWFTHILLVLFLFAYAALGGLLFQALEAPHEEMVKIDVERAQREALVELWQRANEARTIDQFKENGLGPLEVLQGEYYKAFNNGITSGFGKRTWTFWGSVFYCGTIITTIGQYKGKFQKCVKMPKSLQRHWSKNIRRKYMMDSRRVNLLAVMKIKKCHLPHLTFMQL
jgi:hypothetical protein